MASLLAWMDHSEAERRRTLDIVSLFRDRNIRDELGIGTVRGCVRRPPLPRHEHEEARLINALMENDGDVEDRMGREVGRTLKYFPSGIYRVGFDPLSSGRAAT